MLLTAHDQQPRLGQKENLEFWLTKVVADIDGMGIHQARVLTVVLPGQAIRRTARLGHAHREEG